MSKVLIFKIVGVLMVLGLLPKIQFLDFKYNKEGLSKIKNEALAKRKYYSALMLYSLYSTLMIVSLYYCINFLEFNAGNIKSLSGNFLVITQIVFDLFKEQLWLIILIFYFISSHSAIEKVIDSNKPSLFQRCINRLFKLGRIAARDILNKFIEVTEVNEDNEAVNEKKSKKTK